MQCTSTLSNCRCGLEDDGHETHECSDPSEVTIDGRCHGMWRNDGSGPGDIVQFPTGARSVEAAVVHAGLVRRGIKVDPGGAA